MRATAVLLAVLALVLGARAGLGGSGDRPTQDTAQVPTIAAGTPVTAAVAALERAGLEPREQTGSSDDVVAGRVVSQRPAGGTDVTVGSTVLLVVSSGPAAPAVARDQEPATPADAQQDTTATTPGTAPPTVDPPPAPAPRDEEPAESRDQLDEAADQAEERAEKQAEKAEKDDDAAERDAADQDEDGGKGKDGP